MAIIIRSSDIYEKNNHNIMLNNAIKSVSVQEKSLKIGDTTQGNHKEYPDPNPLNESLYSTTIYDGLAAANFERMELFYSKGQVVVPQDDFEVNISPRDISWRIAGTYLGDTEKLTSVSLDMTNKYFTENKKTSILKYDMYSGEQKGFEQTGKWGTNGTFSSYRGLVGTDESFVNVDKDNNGNHIVTYKILTSIAYAEKPRLLDSMPASKTGRGYFFKASNITILVGVKEITITDTPTETVVGDITLGSPTTLESNQLIQPETYFDRDTIAKHNANQVLEDWQNGKEVVDIEVIQGEYYDTTGKKQISITDNHLPMLFTVGQIVIPFVNETEIAYNENSEEYLINREVPLSVDEDGKAKRFYIYDVLQSNDGIGFQRLKLLESSLARKVFVEKDESETITLNRLKSPLANAELGIIDLAEQNIYLNDYIKIVAGGPIGTAQKVLINDYPDLTGLKTVKSNWHIKVESYPVAAKTLTINSATPELLTVNRVKSNAPLGNLPNGSIIYELDVLQVSANDVSELTITSNGEVVGQYVPELGVTTYFKEFEVTGDVVITFKARTETVILENVSTTLSYRADGSFVDNKVSAPLAVVGDKSQTFGTQIKLVYYSSLSGSSSTFEQFVETNYPMTFLVDTTGGTAGVMYGNREELDPFIDNAMAVLIVEVTENGAVNFKNQSKDNGMTRFSRVEVKYMYQLS